MLLIKNVRWLGLGLVLLLTGCGTLKNILSTGAAPPNLVLSEDEINFAKALAHYNQALVYENEQGKDYAKALEHFTAAIELDPARQQLYAQVAMLHLHQKHPQEAIKVLKQACKNNPRRVQSWVDLAVIYELIEDFDNAIEQYTHAIKLAPGTTPLYIELARIYFRQGMDSEALKVVKKGLRKADHPDVILTFSYNCGVKYIAAKQISNAISCFKIITDYDPSKTLQFSELLGELYAGLGNKEEAVRYFTLATESDPPKPNPFLKLAALHIKTDPAKALETLNHAARIFPDNPTIFFSLGFLYCHEEQFDNAIREFQRSEEAAEKSEEEKLNATFYLNYGAAYERSGQIEKAEEIFEKCLKLYPQTHEVLNYLAYMWAENGVKLEKGLEYIIKALELDPNNGAYIDTLGWIYYKCGKYTKALEQIQKANELIKNDPTIIDHLGDIFNDLEEKEKAISYWKQSFLLDPENETVAEKLKNHDVNLDQLRKEAGKDKSIEQEETKD